jgi:dipeptidyl aminopeptidase/acylaminoacyl peptidase
MTSILTYHAASSMRLSLVSTMAVLVSLSVGGGAAARAHEQEPVVDVSRYFGPIDPRLNDAGGAVAFSFQGAVWRMPRDGGVMTRLTDGVGFDVAPAWSPDGKRIAFITSDNFSRGPLRLIRAEDGSNIPLPRTVVARGKLAFDRSGTRILGIFQEPGKESALAWFIPETGRLEPAPTGLAQFRNFALSGDGLSIALVSTQDVAGRQGGNDGPEADLWTLPAQGGTPRAGGEKVSGTVLLLSNASDEKRRTPRGPRHSRRWSSGRWRDSGRGRSSRRRLLLSVVPWGDATERHYPRQETVPDTFSARIFLAVERTHFRDETGVPSA